MCGGILLVSIRWGILGTARIAPTALIAPARKLDAADVVAVASRDGERARAFAQEHEVSRHHASYEALLDDADVDAVYIPLPNSLHHEWTLRALDAGKHVLCEKPLASNAVQAREMAQAAEHAGKLLVEGMHYRHHPYAAAVRDVLDSGALGAIQHIEAALCVPILRRSDIRYQYELGGGALMDLGCYVVNLVRWIAGSQPKVVSADVRTATKDIDRWVRADLQFAGGATGQVTCAFFTPRLVDVRCKVQGENGSMTLRNPYIPHLFNVLRVDTSTRKQRGMQPRGATSYEHQLQAVCAAIEGAPLQAGTADEAVKTLEVIDAIYRTVGLPLRGAQRTVES